MGKQGDLEKLARGGTIYTAGLVFSRLFGFVALVIITRGLGPRGAGAFFEAVAVFTITCAIATVGVDTGMLWAIPRARLAGGAADVRNVLRIGLLPVLAGSLLGVGSFLLLAGPLARLLAEGQAEVVATYLRVLAPFIPVTVALAVVLAATRGYETMLPSVAVEQIGLHAVRPLSVGLVLATGMGAAALALAWAVPTALALLAGAWWLSRLIRRPEVEVATDEDSIEELRATARSFWAFTSARAVARVFLTSLRWLDVVLVGVMAGTAAAGIYAAASRLITSGTFFMDGLGVAISPQISRLLARRDEGRARTLYQTSAWWSVVAGWPVYLTLAIFPSAVMSIFGDGFAEGGTALAILSVAMLASLAAGPVPRVLLMTGKTRLNLLNTGAALVVNMTLNVLLIPRFRLTGAAIAWGAAILLTNGLPLLQLWNAFQLTPIGRGLGVAIILAAACFGASGLAFRAVLGESLPTLAASLVASSLVYLVLLWRFRKTLRLDVLRTSLRRSARTADREAEAELVG